MQATPPTPDDPEAPLKASARGWHSFAHEAMATTFQIVVAGPERTYAQQAADDCWTLLDRLEAELSRFVDTSDISRIGGLPAGGSTRVVLSTFSCLQIAQEMHRETGGAFDVTVGSLFRCWRDEKGRPLEPTPEEVEAARARTGTHHLSLDEESFAVSVDADEVRVDLGGIGKGFALDEMATLLKEDWEIPAAVLHGGGSTVLVLDPPPGEPGWPIGLGDVDAPPLKLARTALSASGAAVKGFHVIDPRTAQPVEVEGLTWARAPSAARSDALSTAFMVMAPEEINAFCQKHPNVGALRQRPDPGGGKPRLQRFGRW